MEIQKKMEAQILSQFFACCGGSLLEGYSSGSVEERGSQVTQLEGSFNLIGYDGACKCYFLFLESLNEK